MYTVAVTLAVQCHTLRPEAQEQRWHGYHLLTNLRYRFISPHVLVLYVL